MGSIMEKNNLMKKQLVMILALSALFCSLVTGCSSKSQPTEQKEEKQTVSEEKATEKPQDNTGSSLTEPGVMRDITAQQLVDEMTLGWNLGDTLDVCEADRDGDGQVNETAGEGEEVDETLWGNPKTTKAMFDKLKEYGFNAVRIPVTWRDHTGQAPEYAISETWMNRVEEVVRYAYDNGMYVILNIHHDGGGDPDFGAWICHAAEGETQKEEVLARYTAVWQQIAKRFQNYSDYLVFESMNEVGFDSLSQEEGMEILNEINQKFVDIIRRSGGNNEERHLLIAGYWTDIEKTCTGNFQMPKDNIKDREMLSVHYYTPWEFCTTNMQNTWGTKKDLKLMQSKIDMLEEHFVKKNIPVIIGEYGVGRNEEASCNYFIENMVKICHEKKIASYLWDNGQGAHFDRETLGWRTDGQLEALQRAVSGKEYQVKKE